MPSSLKHSFCQSEVNKPDDPSRETKSSDLYISGRPRSGKSSFSPSSQQMTPFSLEWISIFSKIILFILNVYLNFLNFGAEI